MPKIDSLQDQVAANQQVTQLYQRQFDLNQRTFLDLLDEKLYLDPALGLCTARRARPVRPWLRS